jgi:hypothetical protein
MANLTYLVTEGQRLIEDAQQERFDDYAARCESWNQKVQRALFQQALSWRPLGLTRFREAQPINTPQSGIPNNLWLRFFAARDGAYDALVCRIVPSARSSPDRQQHR